MPFLKSMPADAGLLSVFTLHPATALPLLDYHEALLRGESPLSIGERELIAAFVSALNACNYCHGVHSATAAAFGIDETTITTLLADIDTSAIDERLKPLFRYVRKLTLSPSRMLQADADVVFAAGWSEDALYHAVSVCALFNFMNRLVDGLGIVARPQYIDLAADRLHDGGYNVLKTIITDAARSGST